MTDFETMKQRIWDDARADKRNLFEKDCKDLMEKASKDIMTIEVQRNGKWIKVDPEELTNSELCDCLANIQIGSVEFISNKELNENYAAIDEAIRRLNQ